MMKDIIIGDWVFSCSKGIYLVERIISRYFDESDIALAPPGKHIGDEHDHRTIVVKRFLNSVYKKSFGYEVCSEFFIRPLEEEAKGKVIEFIRQNQNYYTQFEKYQVPAILNLYNVRLNIEEQNKHLFEDLIAFTKQGKTYSQIIEKMYQLDLHKYVSQRFSNALLQLVNIEFEAINKRLIYRDAVIK